MPSTAAKAAAAPTATTSRILNIVDAMVEERSVEPINLSASFTPGSEFMNYQYELDDVKDVL